MIEIDYKQLNSETLNSLLTEIVLREGTDYGVVEVSVADKKKQLLNALVQGTGVLVYHHSEGFCEVFSRVELDKVYQKISTKSVDNY